jgi:2-alkenal reductase
MCSRVKTSVSSLLKSIIVAANGTPVRSPFDLTNMLERVGIGKTIDLSVKRDGKTTSMPVAIIDVDQPR